MSEQRVSDKRLSEVAELVREGHIDAAEFEEELLAVFDDLLAARAEIEERNSWLAECYRQAGGDPDGNEDWRLAPDAVAAVKEQRADYDDACEEIVQLSKRAEKAERELQGCKDIIGTLDEGAQIRQRQFVEVERELARVQAQYHDLLLGVARKFPGESRHDTAKRYVSGAESHGAEDCARAYDAKEPKEGER